MQWTNKEYLFGKCGNFKFSKKVACFDIDDTIIKTVSGATFAKDDDDWEFTYKCVPDKLKSYYDKDFCIIFVTNQRGLKTDDKLTSWKIKIGKISKKFNFPFIVYASITDDFYRKPMPTIFNMINDEMKIDKTASFYCGDAAGRKNDFSDSDLKFAINSNIPFITPEEFFNDEKKKVSVDDVEYPFEFDKLFNKKQDKTQFKKVYDKEMIIMTGFPGSGKSNFVENVLVPLDYKRINRDLLKTKAKCISECEKNLKKGLSVVIDNTNPDEESRKLYIDLALKYKYKCRSIEMNTPFDVALHNAHYRCYKSNGKIKVIPKIVYHKYKKDYSAPNKNEGFELLDKIDFVPDKNDIDNYKLYFLSK
ncbi:MAG: polynucleotide phosphatase/kinase [Edafosvirus sp.]|uniref:Polynucleotide phosphatase/kinase n=1 Tax=Edafosvirus sp. TaxID=2487765 RepID=A0A3G4ZXP5_9VIRU|nr:MAG: polynucleotide phosphatase/kinase [Edafosvirus sp.]